MHDREGHTLDQNAAADMIMFTNGLVMVSLSLAVILLQKDWLVWVLGMPSFACRASDSRETPICNTTEKALGFVGIGLFSCVAGISLLGYAFTPIGTPAVGIPVVVSSLPELSILGPVTTANPVESVLYFISGGMTGGGIIFGVYAGWFAKWHAAWLRTQPIRSKTSDRNVGGVL